MNRGTFLRSVSAIVVAAWVGSLLGCAGEDAGRPSTPESSATPGPKGGGKAPGRRSRGPRLEVVEPAMWMDLYDPERTSPGFHLTLYRRRTPFLIDMAGRLVHSWPEVRAVGRARLTPAGELAVIGVDDAFRLYDWEGRVLWEYRVPESEDYPHHDFALLENGNVLLVVRSHLDTTDYLVEITPRGETVWEWFLRDHLERHFGGQELPPNDRTHVNSVFELPPNRWYEGGDERFRPGNVLVSARNLNAIFVVDRQRGEIVWKRTEGLDYQHEAVMIPAGYPGSGDLLVFNNGYHNRSAYRRSSILRIDPTTQEVVWSYSDDGFFSSTGGTQQPLPNGHLVITSSQGGRVFEVEPGGETVWQWSPPYKPMRTIRYPPDYCPQLAQLPVGPAVAIEPSEPWPWIDEDQYRFAFEGETERRTIRGRQRKILRTTRACRILRIPPATSLSLGFGFDPAATSPEAIAGFVATVRPEGATEATTLLERRLRANEGSGWEERRFPLKDYALQWVELCVAGESVTNGAALLWQEPRIEAASGRSRSRPGAEPSPEDAELAKRQLEALGYLN